MKIRILEEHGHHAAICGLCLSYSDLPDDIDEFNSQEKIELAKRLAVKDGGHNKFLESVVVWLDIDAPVVFWQQFDTYRCGISKQSESKMHTLKKRGVIQSDFEYYVDNSYMKSINDELKYGHEQLAFGMLPMSFLQRRIVCTNYKALRNICNQRRGHKLRQWTQFIDHMEAELMWPWAIKQNEAKND